MDDERGLWRLFFATGLPEVYLAVSQCRRVKGACQEELAKTAFHPRIENV